MRTIILYLNNLLLPLIPESRGYGFKRFMWRLAGIQVGENVKISSSSKVYGAGDLMIGKNTWIGYQTVIVSSSSIKIGANVDIAPKVYIGTGTHTIDVNSDHVAATDISMDVSIGDGTWICANATILPGVIIGQKCVVAAGAVLTRSFENEVMVGGVPAKIIKNMS